MNYSICPMNNVCREAFVFDCAMNDRPFYLPRDGEIWAKEQGCSEFAGDRESHNIGSLQFHLNVGFEEANRIICFGKTL